MKNQDFEYWLRLVRAKIPYRGKLALCQQKFPDYCDAGVIEPLEKTQLQRLEKALSDPIVDIGVESDLNWLHQSEHRSVIAWADPGYPAQLREIDSPPLVLFVEGNQELLSSAQLAIVGSRRASPSGREIAETLAEELSRANYIITSGMAIGIDTAAHRGALNGNGKTIAVIASGSDKIYPRQNKALRQSLIEKGCIVSEFPTGVQPLQRNFPRRNRIISGLSRGVLVVEAAIRSGSLITARLAAEQGREVFAVPGSIRNSQSSGCHKLIRDGAVLVESSDDILSEFGLQFAVERQSKISSDNSNPRQISISQTLGSQAQDVLQFVDHSPATFDQLLKRSGLEGNNLSVALLELELSGLVCKSAGFFTRLR